jgi:hypothetical protein
LHGGDKGARRLSAAAGRRVASTARGDCKSLGRYACMAVAYSHRRRFGGPTTAPYNSIHDLGSACHARSVAEMGTGSPRIRLDMDCLALQLSLIKGHGSCLRSGSSNRCPALPSSALLCPVGYLAFTARPSMHGKTLRAIRDAGPLDLLVRFISPVGISSNSQVLLLHAPAHSTFPPFNFLIGRLPLFSGRAVYFSHDDAG